MMKDERVFDSLGLVLKSKSTYSVDKELANPVLYGEIRDINPMGPREQYYFYTFELSESTKDSDYSYSDVIYITKSFPNIDKILNNLPNSDRETYKIGLFECYRFILSDFGIAPCRKDITSFVTAKKVTELYPNLDKIYRVNKIVNPTGNLFESLKNLGIFIIPSLMYNCLNKVEVSPVDPPLIPTTINHFLDLMEDVQELWESLICKTPKNKSYLYSMEYSICKGFFLTCSNRFSDGWGLIKRCKLSNATLVSLLLDCVSNALFLDYESLLDFLCSKELYYSKNIVREYFLEVFSEDRAFNSRGEIVKGLIKKIENEANKQI